MEPVIPRTRTAMPPTMPGCGYMSVKFRECQRSEATQTGTLSHCPPALVIALLAQIPIPSLSSVPFSPHKWVKCHLISPFPLSGATFHSEAAGKEGCGCSSSRERPSVRAHAAASVCLPVVLQWSPFPFSGTLKHTSAMSQPVSPC